jgi:hypothetical protein
MATLKVQNGTHVARLDTDTRSVTIPGAGRWVRIGQVGRHLSEQAAQASAPDQMSEHYGLANPDGPPDTPNPDDTAREPRAPRRPCTDREQPRRALPRRRLTPRSVTGRP